MARRYENYCWFNEYTTKDTMNILTTISSFWRRLYQKALNPMRDWLTLLTLAAFVLIGIIVWNVWAFDTVANGGIIGTAATSTSPLFSQTSLNTIRTTFLNRTEEEAKYETGTYRFADPSQ